MTTIADVQKALSEKPTTHGLLVLSRVSFDFLDELSEEARKVKMPRSRYILTILNELGSAGRLELFLKTQGRLANAALRRKKNS